MEQISHPAKPNRSHRLRRDTAAGQKAPTRRSLEIRITAIRAAHPHNLAARYFDQNYVESLDENKRGRLLQIVRSGLQYTDSRMGAYVVDKDDYENFAPLLDPMIRDYHNIPHDHELGQVHDWTLPASRYNLAGIDPRLAGVSMRVRVARNVATLPLPGGMAKAQRLDLEAQVMNAVKTLQGDPQFGGQYFSITPGAPHAISATEHQRRVRAHQIFADMRDDPYLTATDIAADWPFGRGTYISADEDFLIWVGEEDHLRIIATGLGGDLVALMARLKHGLERLAELFSPFAHSRRLGYVTSCPTNLGTAMRTSLHLPLPNLTENGNNLRPAVKAAADLGLSVRGINGEGTSGDHRGVVDVSPHARLGLTEVAVIHHLYEGTKALWSLENAV